MDLNDYQAYLMETAGKLLTTDSPSGFTARVVEKAQEIAGGLGYATKTTNKGGLVIYAPGREHNKKIGLCAHIDTLGLMCRAVTEKGELLFAKVGGPILPTLDGEYCKIYTRGGKVYTGTVLSDFPAAHVFKDANTAAREESNMRIRIDEKVKNREEVKALGIDVGDFICIDPKTTVTDSGFLKSRFIDDKGSAACLLTLLKWIKDAEKMPRYDTEIHFTVYEEVGHGGATIPGDLDELLAVDMGCVGDTLSCTEYQVSICAKDSAGPYDYEMVSRLVALAKANEIDYALDVYPFYSSDVAASWRAGSDARAALIGPGVHASHGMERTHWEGMRGTIALVAAYLEST